jgi:hypothetical protein
MNVAQQKVLQMIADGVISAEAGAELLQAMDMEDDVSLAQPSDAEPVVFPPPPVWADQWLGIVLAGTVLLFTGLGFTFLVIGGTVSLWWLLFTLPLTLLGSLVVLLGYLCSSRRWLHICVISPDANFRFSLPLPFSWLTGLLKVARLLEPRLAVITDDVLDELAVGPEGYFYVEVDEADKDEYVQVYYA